MFEGEKTHVFWIGLIVLALASMGLFTIIWYNVLAFYHHWWKYSVPFIVATAVSILIGLYMMKSGAKKEIKRERNADAERAVISRSLFQAASNE